MKPKPIIDGKLQCADCKQWRPVEEFRPKAAGRRVSYCPDCMRARVRLAHRRFVARWNPAEDEPAPTGLTFGPTYRAGGYAPQSWRDAWTS